MMHAQLEESDYVSAVALNSRLSGRKAARYVIVASAIVVLAVVAWVADWYPVFGGAVGGLVGGLLTYALIRFVYAPWKARRVFRQQKSLQRPFEVTWSDKGLTSRDANGEYTTPWPDYTKWKENSRVFLLYHSDVLFQMVPKRAFPDEATLSEFRSRLERQVVT
jgi:hypothetical protein